MVPEDETTEVTDGKETETPIEEVSEDSSTPAAEGGEGDSDESEEEGDLAAEAPAFEANYKFKVMDTEHEIPENLRGFIKDAESQKQITELYEKAYGLDVVKDRYKTTKEQLTSVQEEFGGVQSQLDELRTLRDAKKFEQFFEKLNVPKEQVLQYVLDQVSYNQLPPEEKARVDVQRSSEARLEASESASTAANTRANEAQIESLGRELEWVFGQQNVQDFAKSFDARAGKAGAFREEVIRRGDLEHHQTGKMPPVGQLVQSVVRLFGNPLGTAETAPQAAGTPPTPMPKPKVIPNVRGKGTSPLNAPPRSVADLKKLAAAYD